MAEVHLEADQVERLVVVSGDIEYLQGLSRDRLWSHAEVRIAAGMLRRLVIDGQLQRVASSLNAKGSDILIKATNLDAALDAFEGSVRHGWAGGALTSVVNHSGLIIGIAAESQSNPKFETMTLDAWRRSTSVAVSVGGASLRRISRESVIKYVANRKGGVHFDPSRAAGPPTKVAKQRREADAQILDYALLRVGHLSGPEFEIMSMGQALAEAPWASGFVEQARDIAPEDFGGDPNDLKVWTGDREADGTNWVTIRVNAPEDQPADGTVSPTS